MSDIDALKPWDATDAEVFEAQEDDSRERAAQSFIVTILDWESLYGWKNVFAEYANAFDWLAVGQQHTLGPGRFAWHVMQYVTDYGWASATQCLANAMKQQDVYRASQTDPRRV